MFRKALIGAAILAACTAVAVAGSRASEQKPDAAGHGSHGVESNTPESAETQRAVSELREATARFHRLEVALQEGYAAFGDCFSDPAGGMGFHYANAELMEDPGVDLQHPELLLYERGTDGVLRFVGVEYLTFQDAWHEAGNRSVPKLFGQRFHLNTTLLSEPFYLLHVWQWKHNPSGRFADWNPRVSCR